MKRFPFFLGIALIAVAGCKAKAPAVDTSTSTPQTTPQTPPSVTQPGQSQAASAAATSKAAAPNGPQYDWQQYDEESFETRPSQGRVFTIPQNAARLRAKFTASLPLDAAAMTREVFKGAKGVVREDRLFQEPCASIGVNHDDAKCLLDPKTPSVYVVRDRRAAPSDPVAQLLAKRPDLKSALAGNAAVNMVKVTLYAWACVANCGPLGGPAQ